MVVKTVAVVGAGASGIGAVKACLDEGLSPVCFEQSPNIGGLWFYRDVVPPGLGCVSKTTTTNTSKEMTAFSDFPMPREFPNYPHNTGMQRYMELYVDHFDLRRHIRFEHEVVDVTPAADYNDTGRWLVQVKDRSSGDVTRDEYDAVMICNGHHWEPNRPRLEGEDVFKGRVIHSLQYRDHRGYEDKKVVVVGIGNTGGDIVMDLSRIAKQVSVPADLRDGHEIRGPDTQAASSKHLHYTTSVPELYIKVICSPRQVTVLRINNNNFLI